MNNTSEQNKETNNETSNQVSNSSKLFTRKYSGLYNQGNTCYLNSLLQILFMTPEFREKILQWEFSQTAHGAEKDCIPFQLQKLFSRLQANKFKAEKTSDLTKSFQWHAHEVLEQHDIEELYKVLLTAIDRSLNKSSENAESYSSLFEGNLDSVIKCEECSTESTHVESYTDLALPLTKYSKQYKEATDLEKALLEYLSIELLNNDNKYFCSKCDKKTNARKFYRLKEAPPVLFFHLNRFQFDFNSYCRVKLYDRFSFPQTLNIQNFMNKDFDDICKIYEEKDSAKPDGSRLYELYGVVIHKGNALSGHYYSYIKSFEDSQWYCFCDTAVSQIEEEQVWKSFGNAQSPKDETAYIMLYKRTSKRDYHFGIRDYMREILKLEDVEYQEEERQREERQNQMNIKLLVNGTVHLIQISKDKTIEDLRGKILSKGLVSCDEKDFRIRLLHKGKSLEVLDKDKRLRVQDAGFSHIKSYIIETKKPEEVFLDYDPNKINIKLVYWQEDAMTSSSKNYEFPSKNLEVSKTSTLRELKEKIHREFPQCESLPSDLIAFTKSDYGINNFKIREIFNIAKLSEEIDISKLPETQSMWENKIVSLNIEDQMALYVEQAGSISDSRFLNYFEEKVQNIPVFFNSPLGDLKGRKPKIGSYKLDHEIHIKKTLTIRELKKRISEVINLPSNEFLMRKVNHNGSELNSLNDQILKYSTSQMKVYLEFGTPAKESEVKVNVFTCDYDYSNFCLLPYKISEVGVQSVDLLWTVAELKSYLVKELKERKILNPNSAAMDFIIREFNNEKPSRIFSEEMTLRDYDIKQGKSLLLHCYKPSEVLNGNLKRNQLIVDKNSFQVACVHWKPNDWKFSDPKELLVNKHLSYLDLAGELVKSFEIKVFIP